MLMTDPQAPAPPPPAMAALAGLCPRCGTRGLFAGITAFAPRCRACGLDFAAFNVDDGPAAFLILIVGAVIVAAAVTVELVFSPPWWTHVLLWGPLTLGLVIGSLRIAKGLLIALEYRHQAREGRIKDGR